MTKAVRLTVLAAILLLFRINVSAWDDTGHMVVGYIAYSNLSQTAKAKVNKLLAANNGFQLCGRRYNPVTIANWMDDLRDIGNPAPYAEWHYINFNPVFSADFPSNIPKNQFKPLEENVMTQLNWAIRKLQSEKNFDTTSDTDDDKEAVFALAFLIHLVGDVHQPLHCATRYSANHTGGDFGGNLFTIQFTKNKLHSFWDGAGGLFNFQTVARPANNTMPANLAPLAKTVTDKVPAMKNGQKAEWVNRMTPLEWVQESNEIAHNFAFHPNYIQEGSAPSPAYIQEAQRRARERIAYAGYRLAEALNRIYS